ncbi:MAG: alpha/beta fold hydrolase [Acidobacteriota bacterium]
MTLTPEKRLLVAAGLFLVAAPFLASLSMDLLVRQMLYPAPPVPVPATPPAPLEALTLTSSEGDQIVAWARERPGSSVAVLFLHGNGENLATLHWSGLFDEFHRLGASTLAIDYPSYGRSTGKPSQASLTAAGIAGFRALQDRFPESRHAIVGWSLGAAIAMQVAVPVEEELSALAVLSPWHDLPSLAKRFFPGMLVNMALKDRYHSGDAAASLRLKTLVVHGATDELIPVEQGRRLATRLPAGSRVVELDGVGHNELMGQSQTWSELAAWLGLDPAVAAGP